MHGLPGDSTREATGKRTACLGGQGLAALGTTAADDGTTVGSAHAGAEAVSTLSADLAGLIRSFHVGCSLFVYFFGLFLFSARARRLSVFYIFSSNREKIKITRLCIILF